MTAAGTVTLMFTDVVGSTALLGRLGEEAAERAMRRHFEMLRAELGRTGGREIKSLGDGLMVAFPSASEAVGCAIAMQQAAARHDDGLGLRVGLHAGEPAADAGDCFGTPVVIARRLCDHAQGGQIVASEVVRGLVGRPDGHRFGPLGEIRVKGLGDPVAACAVRWSAAERANAAAPPEQPPLPAPLAGGGATAFVGRVDALTRLRRCLREASEGHLRLIAVSGEPGIGKTRLAREFASHAHADGAAVLYGRAEDEGLVPYQPFAEAVRGYLQSLPRARPAAGALGHLVPDLQPHGELAGTDPSLQRYMLFEATAAFLAASPPHDRSCSSSTTCTGPTRRRAPVSDPSGSTACAPTASAPSRSGPPRAARAAVQCRLSLDIRGIADIGAIRGLLTDDHGGENVRPRA